jgi:mitogen-activated protein kinase kinase kinase
MHEGCVIVVSWSSTEESIKWHTANPPKILGQGTFGRVYEAIDDETGEIIAVKEVGTHASRSKSIAALQKEMMTLRLLRHANIIQYKGFEHHPEEESILFLMEVHTVERAHTHNLSTHTHTRM